MPATLTTLLAQPQLGLRAIVADPETDAAIRWIHNSDLRDPTPFLEPGNVLLTTGTQFPADAAEQEFHDYVARVAQAGVIAIGFGTEVVRTGTPPELIDACASARLPLFEVPYRTPFLAVIRWAADTLAAEARARDDWSLRAQRAISLAALGARGIPDALDALARQLNARVGVFDRRGDLDPALSPGGFRADELAALSAEAARLLRRGRRSASEIELEDARAHLQTLGHQGQLGVIAVVVAADEPHDAAIRAVITGAVALTEVSLEQSRQRRLSLLPLYGELLGLLLSGHGDAVQRAFPGLLDPPLRALVCDAGRDGPERLAGMIEHRPGPSAGSRTFAAPHRGRLTVLVPASAYPGLSEFLSTASVRAGVSRPAFLPDLPSALWQAEYALEHADGRTPIAEFGELADIGLLDVIQAPCIAELAAVRLGPLTATAEGTELLHQAARWLAHNGAWDPASRELGLHRHVLKSRLRRLEQALGLSLERFSDRAELWTMLTALGLA